MKKTVNIADLLAIFTLVLSNFVPCCSQTVYTCDANSPCGCSKESVSVSRIVGGEAASTGAWGWAVSLNIDSALCGGSIIADSWVVTAAHCTRDQIVSDITVYAGSNTRWSGRQVRKVKRIIDHPKYNPTTFESDISLLELDTPLDLSDPYVSKICLPSVSAATLAAGEWPAVGTSLVTVGWGTLSEGGQLPLNIQQVTVKAVAYNDSTCKPVMSDRKVQFCAGVSGGGKDSCQGDSGGPLMLFNSSNLWVLTGATSSGIGCAQAANAGMYTRVVAFVDWLTTSMNSVATTTTAKTTTSFSISDGHTIATSFITLLLCALLTFFAITHY